MAFHAWLISATLFSITTSAAFGQQAKPNNDPPTIVQPGAPGQTSKQLTPATASVPVRTPNKADVEFMQGMIIHHSQAVEMTALMKTRCSNKDLLLMGDRISISQTDEIKYMKQWLTDRGQPIEMQGSMDMGGMSMADMKDMKMEDVPLMPGMLTPKQMAALAKASGPEFDRLFLTGMIQHHGGALTMVQDLFDTPGSGQDAVLFDFATDVDNTQRAEIRIMQAMLSKEKK